MKQISVLILCPATLPNSLMSSNSFLIESLRFSMYRIVSSANSDSFTSSFWIWIPFISFYSPIAMARTSRTMLNKIGRSRHPLSCSWSPRKHFKLFTIEWDITCEFVIYSLYYVDIGSLYAPFLESFLKIINWYWIFIKSIFCIYWGDHMIFILFVNVVYPTDQFADIETSLHLWSKTHLITVYVYSHG